jgi:hypothetical protein
MNDYFDQLEQCLKEAVARRAHLRWYARVRLPVRHRGLVIVLAALVVAAPAVAAVGAASGWFSPGKPDVYYPASSTSGLGKVLPTRDRLLPIRVADPDGGPAWGVRLVRTSRGDTCIQVGRVEEGQIGALGIDGAWKDDHEFHEIKPNDGLADICGATDGAGNGFVNQAAHGAPASVDVPLYNSGGGSPGRCRSPYASLVPGPLLQHARKLPPTLKKLLKRVEEQRAKSPLCPANAMRMVFAGLLGPDAKSITYKTPTGQTKIEQTSGGVGAYLIVFKETKTNCADFTGTLDGGGQGCESDGTGDNADLAGPTAVTSVTYRSGETCSVQPSPSFAAAYEKFVAQSRDQKHDSAKQERARFAKFLARYHLTERTSVQAITPQCAPVGWVAAKQKRVTLADVASPLRVSVSEGRRFCSKGPWSKLSVQDDTIVCDHKVPKGYTSYYESRGDTDGPLYALIRVSFTAREPVTTSNSFYEWNIQEPGNHGGEGNRTQANVRRGETVTFTMSEAIPGSGPHNANAVRGVYHGTIGFMPNVGQVGPQNGGDDPGRDGSLIVGRFSFRLPLSG